MRTATTALLATTAFIGAAAFAQGNYRASTDAESQVIDRYTRVIERVFDRFRGEDWDESIDYTLDGANVYVGNPVPLEVDAALERHYDVRMGSPRWNRKLAPLAAQLQAAATPSAMAAAGQQMKRLQHVHVRVRFNRQVADVSPAPPANTALNISGPALAFKIDNDEFQDGVAYVLLFGRWQPAKWSSNNGGYVYAFARKASTPFIENIEIRIFGAEDRLDELLHEINWNQVNEALTP